MKVVVVIIGDESDFGIVWVCSNMVICASEATQELLVESIQATVINKGLVLLSILHDDKHL